VRSFEIEPFVVWISFGTEIPKPSSQIEIASGTCRTPAAFSVSQNIPSLVPALPPVANVTSSPFLERPSATARSPGSSRNSFDAYASPSARGSCAATGERSDAVFASSTRRCHSPSLPMVRDAKWLTIWRPAEKGSWSASVSA
jgi:hypothetical protein